jgi:hypothetical protein
MIDLRAQVPDAPAGSIHPGDTSDDQDFTTTVCCGGDPACASWALTIAALDSLRRAGRPHLGEEAILRQLRHQLRQALLRDARDQAAYWVVPATPQHLTHAYLVALSLTRHGEGVRIWPWPHPAPGPALVVGNRWTRFLRPRPAGAA